MHFHIQVIIEYSKSKLLNFGLLQTTVLLCCTSSYSQTELGHHGFKGCVLVDSD